jgi:SAM-dependent methyltransferase
MIALAERRAEVNRVRCQFVVGDVGVLADNYDAILCISVLHHVPIREVLPRLLAHLRPGGRAVFMEPIALAPALRRLRLMLPIPVNGSPDEHPLAPDEFRFVLSCLPGTEVYYFDVLARLARLRCDTWLRRLNARLLPALQRWAGVAVMGWRQPA